MLKIETVNVINPKYTRSQITNTYNDLDNYAHKNSSNLVSSTCKSNGNALKLYKKVDEDSGSKVSSLIKFVRPVYKLFRKVINNDAWKQLDKIKKGLAKKQNHYSKIDGNEYCDDVFEILLMTQLFSSITGDLSIDSKLN